MFAIRSIAIVLTFAVAFSHAAEITAPEFTPVFIGGSEGFHTFRIPAIILAADKTVLAFAEGRKGRGDQSENALVLKRSSDGGKTWAPLQIIAQDGKNSLNNPCVVVVRETGRVLLMYQRYTLGAAEYQVVPGYDGDKIVRSFLIFSDDHGKTWSQPEDITKQVKPPDATSLASGPGIGIQLRAGPHAGRIVIPFNKGPRPKWTVFAAFSDDQGKTWHYGDVAPAAADAKGAPNEVQIVELKDGVIRLNARNEGGNHLRKTALSKDGGKTWSELSDVKDLPDPVCQASILRYSDANGAQKSRILYSAPGTPRKRSDGTIYLSYDEGETWPVKKELQDGLFAYSNLVLLPDGMIGCVFETGSKDPYEKLVLAKFSLNWLTDGKEE